MKFTLAAATLPLLASGYTMGGNSFGRRPVIISNIGACGPAGAPSNADKAFDNLKREVSDASRRRRRNRGGGREMTKEEAARQREWLNRAFGLATEAASAMAGVDIKEGNESLRQQQEWLGRAFGVDVDPGVSTPRFEINDTEEFVQVAIDLPGVKQSDIDIDLEEDVLTISGERDIGLGDVTRKTTFRKRFELDSTVEKDKITAKLNNGVLLVTAPKNIPVPDVKKIPIMQVEDEEETIAADDAEIEAKSDDVDENDNDADQAGDKTEESA